MLESQDIPHPWPAVYLILYTLIISLRYIGRCLSENIVNHLNYSDGLVIFSSTAFEINELLRECEQFSKNF